VRQKLLRNLNILQYKFEKYLISHDSLVYSCQFTAKPPKLQIAVCFIFLVRLFIIFSRTNMDKHRLVKYLSSNYSNLSFFSFLQFIFITTVDQGHSSCRLWTVDCGLIIPLLCVWSAKCTRPRLDRRLSTGQRQQQMVPSRKNLPGKPAQ
jgi:hypothetical protein